MIVFDRHTRQSAGVLRGSGIETGEGLPRGLRQPPDYIPPAARVTGWVTAQVILLVALIGGLLVCPPAAVLADPGGVLAYPKARQSDQVDTYHGVQVADPYRWLEDPDSPETRAWIEAENAVTFGYLKDIPNRDKVKARLTQLWNYERYGNPRKHGGRYFFEKNDGLQDQYVLYAVDSLDGTPKVLLDPNKLSEDGTVSLTEWVPSEDGRLLAYGLAESGSDWQEWRVKDVETGNDLVDHVRWVKFSAASWTKDGKGFFYGRYDEPTEAGKFQDTNYFQKVFYHRLGTPQSQDELVYERPDEKEWGFTAEVTDDGYYLVINVRKGTERKNLIFYKDLRDEEGKVQELIREFEAAFEFIDNDGPVFWMRTDLDTPRGRLVAVDIRKADRAHWKDVIPQAKEILQSVDRIGDRFVASYLKDAYSQVRVFDLQGTAVTELQFPTLGSARGFSGKRDDPETFYRFESYLDPGTVFRYDVRTGQRSVFKRPKVDFPFNDFETKQVFYTGKDGTRIPMFLTASKSLTLGGNNPTLLYGYGGFNIPITPRFRVSSLVWLELGGVYAVANIRGGGEYGREWHEAGKKFKKQNVFDDFIAAAEWLIANKYTTSEKLAIRGGSNGGLLVGACMTQRPDLFGVCLPAVGVMDMIRFSEFTIGWAWTSDYGSAKDPEEFKALYAYSPLHNLKPGTAYPATLITTADHDDRVVPAHSFKFAARLQEVQSGPAPTLIRIQTKAGHGAGMPTSMRIEEATDVLGFMVKRFGMPVDFRR